MDRPEISKGESVPERPSEVDRRVYWPSATSSPPIPRLESVRVFLTREFTVDSPESKDLKWVPV